MEEARKIRLTIEQKEDLEDLLNHEGIKALYLEMESVCLGLERDVIQCDLSTSTVEQLVHKKCRAEGARAFFRSLRTRLDGIKSPQPKK